MALHPLGRRAPRASLSGHSVLACPHPDPPKSGKMRTNVLEELVKRGLLIQHDDPGSFLPASVLLDLVHGA